MTVSAQYSAGQIIKNYLHDIYCFLGFPLVLSQFSFMQSQYNNKNSTAAYQNEA